LGAITQIIAPDEVIDFGDGIPDLDGPNRAFTVSGELLFGAQDRWGN
jgi:hypothetical protein